MLLSHEPVEFHQVCVGFSDFVHYQVDKLKFIVIFTVFPTVYCGHRWERVAFWGDCGGGSWEQHRASCSAHT